MHEPSAEFACCWNAAGHHLQLRAPDRKPFWIKSSLTPPFLEHFSFRLGNQLFFVRVEDAEGLLGIPGTRHGLATIAEGCRGHACLMPMNRRGRNWEPAVAGWGLVELASGTPIEPFNFVTAERIEMTDWEVHDFAVQVVRDKLTESGRKFMSWSGAPRINPSIWFVGCDGSEWIVVKAVRYPNSLPAMPDNWSEIAEHCKQNSQTGHFAAISIASADDSFDTSTERTPLWRGFQMTVRYPGLIRLDHN